MARLNFTSAFDNILKRNRRRAFLLGIGVVCLLLFSAGLYLQKKDKGAEEQVAVPESVGLMVGQKNNDAEEGRSEIQQEKFFLRPLPDELLQRSISLENFKENAADAKFTGMRVLWPVYYFANQDLGQGKTNLLLDVSEDGFGILIESEVELSVYPAIATLQEGQKIWIGGEILAVDPSGTGTIHLKAEHLHFSEEQPFQTRQQQTN